MSHLRDSPPTPGTRLPLTYDTRLTPGSPSVHARRFPAPGRSLIHQNDHSDIKVHLSVLPKKNIPLRATRPSPPLTPLPPPRRLDPRHLTQTPSAFPAPFRVKEWNPLPSL